MADDQLVNLHDSIKQQIDNAKGGTAATVNMMAHEHQLPASVARYRLHKEMRTINDWLNAVNDSGRILDVGYGTETWSERYPLTGP